MREGERGEQFLNEKYPDLQHSEEVEGAVKRQEVRTGEKAKDKTEKVEAYLSRLEEVFDVENPKRERRVDILKDKLHELFVVKPEDIPESYFNHQKRIAREQGHGDIEITDQTRSQMAEIIIHDQSQSLDVWVDYLGSADAPYPNWLKYFAFRSVTKLSEYDKEKKEFKKRSKGTTALFPDINREALAYVLDSVEKSHKKEAREDTSDEKWEKLLKTANFGKLYAHAIEKITPATEEEKENIQGEWIKYEQGSDAEPLYKSLQGHGTGWCTAGEGVAKTQLEAGDFYVFYSKNKQGENKTPRVAIRMENGEIAEVRGINADQNLEAVMTDVAKEKMRELPGAEKYEKKVSDMKCLTEIEKKFIDVKKIERDLHELVLNSIHVITPEEREVYTQEHKGFEVKIEQARTHNWQLELTKEELRFLYEIDAPIDGFGYLQDPRIDEIIGRRDKRIDIASALDIRPEEISFTQDEALCGGIKYHFGDISSRDVAFTEKLELPEVIRGHLNLDALKDAKNVKFPRIVGKELKLGGLKLADGVVLPEQVGDRLDLSMLVSAKGLIFPKVVGYNLWLFRLKSIEGLKLPKIVGGVVSLYSISNEEKEVLKNEYPNLKIG